MDLSSQTTTFIKNLNKNPDLFNRSQKSVFIPTISWPKFSINIKKPFVIFVCRPGLTGVPLHIDNSQRLALGYLHSIFTHSLHVGYIFEIDLADKVEYNSHYIMASKKDVNWDQKIKPEVALTNQYLTVYSFGEEFILAACKTMLVPINKPA